MAKNERPAYLKNHSLSSASEKKVLHVTDGTFEEEVLKADKPVFVDFWAPWCGPCRMVAPLIEQLAQEFSDRMKFVKVNTDENPLVASQLGIRSIPTLVIFNKGEVVDVRIGAAPLTDLRDMVLAALGEKKGFWSRLF